MESLDTAGWIIDDLLDFSSDIGEENENKNNTPNNNSNKALTSSLPLESKPLKDEALTTIFDPDKETPFLPHSEVIQEEELEWLSNENAFPPIETFIPMKPNIELKHQSPISIKLETSTISSSSISCSSSSSSGTLSSNITLGVPVPVQARSQRRRRKRNYLEYSGHKWRLFRSAPEKRQEKRIAKVSDGRKCTHCLSEKTPQWRAGPMGPKTLCNACGVRYKSGRLVPEYRPASSPTFVTEVHSNSHRKIMEMRKHKEKPSSLSVDNG